MAGGEGGRGLTSSEEQEHSARLRAQTTLANLFLDTEFDDDERVRMAARLEATGLSPDELETMLKHEIAPVFGSNMFSMAGEWVWWSEDEVAPLLASGLGTRGKPSLYRRLIGRLAYPRALPEWQKWRARMEASETR